MPIVATVDEALAFEPTTALVGVATRAGASRRRGASCCGACIASGLDVENGLHEFLADDEELGELAARHGVELRDLRRPPAGLNVPDRREPRAADADRAHRRLRLRDREDDRLARARPGGARHAGSRPRFVPTGQTGIAIAGWGIAVDAVVSDFIAGAAERLVVEGHERGGELLFVEGQGSLTHPAYSGVTLGLIHGSAPHAFVLCHQAGADRDRGLSRAIRCCRCRSSSSCTSGSRSRRGRPGSRRSR